MKQDEKRKELKQVLEDDVIKMKEDAIKMEKSEKSFKTQLIGGLVGLILGISVITPSMNTYISTKSFLEQGYTRSKIEHCYKVLSKNDMICKYIITLGAPGKNLAYKLYEKGN